MAEYTVSDILGVGFKYEQTAEEQIVPAVVGTKAALIGSANWGPIATPIYISGGLQEFKTRFGFAGTSVDEGYEAALYHFKWSNQGYFSRVSSTSTPAKRSYKEVTTSVLPAIVTGDVDITDGINLIPNSGITFTITHRPALASGTETLTANIVFDELEDPIKSTGALLEATVLINTTLSSSDVLEFEVYNESGTLSSEISFTGSSQSVSSASTLASAINGSATGLTNNAVVTSSGSVLQITTEPYFYGSQSRIKITTASGIFSTLFALSNREDYGTNVSSTSIVNAINAFVGDLNSSIGGGTLSEVYGSSFAFAGINLDGNLVFTSPSTGSESNISITNSAEDALDVLGLSLISKSGSTGIVCGTFRAVYRGKEGDTISVVTKNSDSENPLIEIYFRGTLVSVIANYNFNPNSSEYLPTVLSDNPTLSQIIKYDHGKTFSEFDEDDDSLDSGTVIPEVNELIKIGDGTWNLTGGDSGENGIVTSSIITEINKFSNIDVYDLDIISCPGYPEQAIQDAMINNVANVRQDTWVVLDAPQIVGTNAVTNIAKWTNGTYTGRTEKLNSHYASVYFPYIKIRKRLYNSSMEVVNTLQDHSPTTRIIGAFTRNDFLSGSKFSAPAGELRMRLEDVEGIQTVLTQGERDVLYADIYDGIVNPIAFNIESGFYVGGQKTALRKNANGRLTALSRINVMRVGLYIKKETQRMTKFFFHEPTDATAQSDFQSMLEGIMRFLVDRRAIEPDFVVVCDSSVNTPSILNNNGMVATISFTPIKTLERLKVISTIKERSVTVQIS